MSESKLYASKNLNDFVTEKTFDFFDRFCLSTDYMQFDPSSWMDRQDYRDGIAFCSGLHVVNDTAERGVKLMTEYNSILTKSEEDKQFALQVVEDYRRQYPSYKKADLLNH